MKKIFYFLFTISILISCQKVINVDLNEANSNIVIEGIYTAEDSTVRVTISLTSSYFNSNPPPIVDGAIVSITDFSGLSINIPHIGNGIYELENYIPNFNSTYTLNVTNNGISYSAQCDLTNIVPLDDMTYELFPGFFGEDGGYVVYLNFIDPINITNHYQIVLSLNGEEFNSIDETFTQDDLFTDGNPVSRPLFLNDFFQINDTIGMELRSIDKDIYYYLNETISIVGANGASAAAPANPNSNWNNNALGYFSAYGNSRKETIIIP